jgi:hypothetical protein
MQHKQAHEVDVGAVHDVDGARLRHQQIEGVNVMQLAVRDMDEAWNIAAQIEQRVHFTADFVMRKCVLGNTDRHKSMVVESRA